MKKCDNSTRKIHISSNFILSISHVTPHFHGTHISTNAVPIIGQITNCKPNVSTQLKTNPHTASRR